MHFPDCELSANSRLKLDNESFALGHTLLHHSHPLLHLTPRRSSNHNRLNVHSSSSHVNCICQERQIKRTQLIGRVHRRVVVCSMLLSTQPELLSPIFCSPHTSNAFALSGLAGTCRQAIRLPHQLQSRRPQATASATATSGASNGTVRSRRRPMFQPTINCFLVKRQHCTDITTWSSYVLVQLLHCFCCCIFQCKDGGGDRELRLTNSQMYPCSHVHHGDDQVVHLILLQAVQLQWMQV
mmetsp:Transcript_59379/g.98427  ORF Transcript_59379/g.98427 Transcript_59379/m.98427 type:complete len:240 (+) Transcript_59379:293-1012(+)